MSSTFTDPNIQQDFESYFRNLAQEEYRKAAGGVGPPPVVAPNQPTPIEIPINGQTYKFNSREEAGEAINKAFLAQQEAARQAIAQAQAATGQPAEPQPDPAQPQYDENKYMKLMAENKFIEAQDYIDEFRPSVQELKSKLQESEQIKQTLAAYQFKEAHPDYVGSPRNAAVIRGILDNSGLEVNPQNLEMAYALAKERRWVDLPQVDPRLLAAQQAQWAAQQQQQDRVANNPGVATRQNPYQLNQNQFNQHYQGQYDPSITPPPNTGMPQLGNRTGYAAAPDFGEWLDDPNTSTDAIEKFIKVQSGRV